MVEVFKTNVTSREDAEKIIHQIQKKFDGYKVNFDLDDCDRILRVECRVGFVQTKVLYSFLKDLGTTIEVLQDFPPVVKPATKQVLFKSIVTE